MIFVTFCLVISICVALIFSKSNNISSALKIVTAVTLTVLSLGSYDSIREVSGYPYVGELPKDAEIVWARVVEEKEKYIEVWVVFERSKTDRLFTLYHEENPISRLYRIEYTKKRHELVLSILSNLKKGKRQGLRATSNKKGEDAFEQSVQRFSIESKRNVIRKRN